MYLKMECNGSFLIVYIGRLDFISKSLRTSIKNKKKNLNKIFPQTMCAIFPFLGRFYVIKVI